MCISFSQYQYELWNTVIKRSLGVYYSMKILRTSGSATDLEMFCFSPKEVIKIIVITYREW